MWHFLAQKHNVKPGWILCRRKIQSLCDLVFFFKSLILCLYIPAGRVGVHTHTQRCLCVCALTHGVLSLLLAHWV